MLHRSLHLHFLIFGGWERCSCCAYFRRVLIRVSQVADLSMVGVSGKKFPEIRQHLEKNIAGVYKDMDVS